MADHARSTDDDGPLATFRSRLAGFHGRGFNAAMSTLLLLSVVGFLLDVRSHIEGFDFAAEGFLTPEHTVIYGGVAGAAVLLAAVVLARKDASTGWRQAVPDCYGLGLVGLGLFAVGGPGDLVWHSLFGAEANVEALVSPTHLLLATGGVLFGASPLRSTWKHAEPGDWRSQYSAVVPAALVLTILTAFTLYAHPAVVVPGSDRTGVTVALTGIQLHAALLAGVLLLLVERFRLVPGSLAFVVGFNGLAMTLLGASTRLLPAYLLAGLVAELLYRGLEPSTGGVLAFRSFAAAVPAVLTALHFATLWLGDGIAWTVHLWAGSIFLAGGAGLFASYLVVPFDGR